MLSVDEPGCKIGLRRPNDDWSNTHHVTPHSRLISTNFAFFAEFRFDHTTRLLDDDPSSLLEAASSRPLFSKGV